MAAMDATVETAEAGEARGQTIGAGIGATVRRLPERGRRGQDPAMPGGTPRSRRTPPPRRRLQPLPGFGAEDVDPVEIDLEPQRVPRPGAQPLVELHADERAG